jgi:uncharacterized protein (TIGR02145 family)
MKRKLTIILLFTLLVSNIFAQINITFGTAGAINGIPTTVNDLTSVTVKNLNQGTSLTLNGSDILSLTTVTDIKSITGDKGIQIVPNPVNNNGEIRFYSPTVGVTSITITDASGNIIAKQVDNLQTGNYSYSLVGLPSGIYFANVVGTNYVYNTSIVSIGSGYQNVSLNQITHELKSDTVTETPVVSKLKSLKSGTTISYSYTVGDSLVFTGYYQGQVYSAGGIPTTDGQVTFVYYGTVKDIDSNEYKTVYINGYTWMAENLRTTHYNDGTPIPNVTDGNAWASLKSGAYGAYNNTTNVDSIKTLGLLYNAYATTSVNGVTNTHNLCPIGWHIPNMEWENLYLHTQAKDLTTTTNWVSPVPITSTPSSSWEPGYNQLYNNGTGFSAIQSGFRGLNGQYCNINNTFVMWCGGEEMIEPNFFHNNEDVYEPPTLGGSVRCVKDK